MARVAPGPPFKPFSFFFQIRLCLASDRGGTSKLSEGVEGQKVGFSHEKISDSSRHGDREC